MDSLVRFLENSHLPDWGWWVCLLLILLVPVLPTIRTFLNPRQRRTTKILELAKLRYEIEAMKTPDGVPGLKEALKAVEKEINRISQQLSYEGLPPGKRSLYGALGGGATGLIEIILIAPSMAKLKDQPSNIGWVAISVAIISVVGGGIGARMLSRREEDHSRLIVFTFGALAFLYFEIAAFFGLYITRLFLIYQHVKTP